MEPVLSRGVVINEWIGAWIADYEDASCRPTLQLLEKMLREHHGYPRPYDALRRYVRKRFPEFWKKGCGELEAVSETPSRGRY